MKLSENEQQISLGKLHDRLQAMREGVVVRLSIKLIAGFKDVQNKIAEENNEYLHDLVVK
jgi:hypothetical protein